ncbi:MAG: hypothetical protein KDC91_06975 [Flavobacteriaceae bacterium]|nr:hypothetical protein [Flavobacteriaceae bacterium]
MSQEKRISGTIKNEIDVEGIHILNITSRYNTVTNGDGAFSIVVRSLDTLLISSIIYVPGKVVITPEIFEKGELFISLEPLVNELDEVFLGPKLTGNLELDIKTIKTEKQFNFDDVGIPGFKGVPQEKIPNLIGQVITPTAVNIEGLYKYLNGYYKKLKIKRKWQNENVTVSKILNTYDAAFFWESYQVPEDRVYDFLLFCIETSSLQTDFKNENYANVLAIFSEKGLIYNDRISEKKE